MGAAVDKYNINDNQLRKEGRHGHVIMGKGESRTGGGCMQLHLWPGRPESAQRQCLVSRQRRERGAGSENMLDTAGRPVRTAGNVSSSVVEFPGPYTRLPVGGRSGVSFQVCNDSPHCFTA